MLYFTLLGYPTDATSEQFVYAFSYDMMRVATSFFGARAADVEAMEEISYGGLPVYIDENNDRIPMSQAEFYLHRVNPGYATIASGIVTELENEFTRRQQPEFVLSPGEKSDHQLNVQLAQAYALKNNSLEFLSLREYAALTSIVTFKNSAERVVLEEAMNVSFIFTYCT